MRDLTKGSVTGHILHMSAFMGITMLFQTLYFLVDLYFVSGLGKEAIAGVGSYAIARCRNDESDCASCRQARSR